MVGDGAYAGPALSGVAAARGSGPKRVGARRALARNRAVRGSLWRWGAVARTATVPPLLRGTPASVIAAAAVRLRRCPPDAAVTTTS